MKKLMQGNFLIALIGWGAVLLSAEALIYYTRWFIPLLTGHHSFVAPPVNIPELWFIGKIASNAIFLWVGVLLLRLYTKYRRSGYFEKGSADILNKVIVACLALAFIGFVQTICENADALHINQWTSLWAVANSLWRFFTHLIVLREPQTMYLLLAAIVWGIKQFVSQALNVKRENELII